MTIDWGQMATAEDWAMAKTAARRAGMVCSRLQGRLVLGPQVCAALDALIDDPATPWAMAEAIRHANTWHRTSQAIDELGYLLGYSAEEMDALFDAAMTVVV
jgi:hypothetical protein